MLEADISNYNYSNPGDGISALTKLFSFKKTRKQFVRY